MGEIKPKILVASDIHLGSLDSEKDLFIQFLRSIISGEFGNELQALIILGDFIDLCMDVPEHIVKRKKIQEIFILLLDIKKSINLIFVLGNHEIPVTGDYDEKFKHRELKFLSKFKNSDFSELFNIELYCQYLLLKKCNDEDMLLLYNSRDQIESNPIKKIKIDGLDLNSDYRCFLTHGYQFDSDIYRFFVGQIWKSLISSKKYEVKETYDYFWNEVIKEGRKIKPVTLKQMKNELITLKYVPRESIEALFSELSYLEFNLVKANMRVMKKWQRASNPDYYFDEIKEFLEDDEYDFSKINHVIYGHTHHSGISYGKINNQEVEILNSGSWQHMHPTYVEIISKGNLNLKSISNNSNS
ncbi:MAG: metallophosphoesterase [Candidatus Lokiarchaeota archaeon]|nr:metallophosphoesterase [Candidatus Lokiarchaeota archaeon]